MEHHDVLLSGKKIRPCGGGDAKEPAPRLSRSSKWFKPLRESNQGGRRVTSRCMELRQYRADYATGVIIPVASKIGKGSTSYGAFHKDCILVACHYARCTVPAPPLHEQTPDPLLIDAGYLEHGRHAARAHRQQSAGARNDRFAVWRQLPPLKIITEHGSLSYHAAANHRAPGRSCKMSRWPALPVAIGRQLSG